MEGEEAPGEGAVAPEAGQAPAPEPSDSGTPDYGMPEVLQAFGDEPPPFITALEEYAKSEGLESFSVRPEEVGEAGQKLIYNLRKLVTKNNQQLAEHRKGLESERAALERERQQVAQERAAVAALFKHERMQQHAQAPEGEPPEPYTEAWFEWKAKESLAKQVAQFFGDMNGVSEELQQEIEARLAEGERAKQRAELDAFIEQHPDLMTDHYDDVVAWVDKGMSYQEAYDYVRFQKGLTQPKPDPDAEVREARQRMQTWAARGAAARGDMPDGSDIRAAHDYVVNNPEAARAYLERKRRQGGWSR